MRILGRGPCGVLLAGLVSLPLGGCAWVDWLVGNKDATLNGGYRWVDSSLPSPEHGPQARIWVRVRVGDVDQGRVRVLSSRVRRVLSEKGWQVVEERSPGAAWLDLRVRYWGVSPVNDRGVSALNKVVRAHDPALLEAGETERLGELSTRAVLTPGAALITRRFSNLEEYVLILDLHLRAGASLEAMRSLVVWARRIDLGEQEAAVEISEQVLAALSEVF
jgi:hypothetical protein